MSSVYFPSKEDIEQMITLATRQVMLEVLPDAIRKATRKEWLTTKEAMKVLSCSDRHLQHLRDTNQIIFTQNGRTIRYHIDDLEQFLHEQKVY